jgi:hypothetical protein
MEFDLVLYYPETYYASLHSVLVSLTFRKEYRLSVFENRGAWRIFEPKREDVTRRRKKLEWGTSPWIQLQDVE